jgi:hypothetical protein
MSNRLEHEFPTVRWHRSVPGGVDHHLVRSALAHGRHLQGAAIRRGLRAIGRALAGFVRCGAYGIAKQAPASDCRQTARRAA